MQSNPLFKTCFTICMFWYVTAHAQVNPAFTYSEGCNGVVTFTATQQTDTFYLWSFGDNTFDSGPTVVHQYAQGSAIYNVTLSVFGVPGYDTSSQPIYIGQFIQQQITGPTDICLGTTASYSLANASANLQYTWLTATGTLIGNNHSDSIQVLYTDTGSSVLSVLISNGAGCDSILQQTVNVHPNPHLILPGQGTDTNQLMVTICQNDPVWYYVLSQVPGNITWNTTGGITLSAQGVDSMEFVFPNVGTTSIQIREVTQWGCSDSVTEQVTVSPTPVVTASSVNACLGSDNYFTATSVPPGASLTYQWLFDDGAQATGMTVAHTFATSGQHSAMVIATNANGCSDTVITTAQVDVNPGPVITCVGPVCSGTQQVYTTPPVNGASYNWSITGGTITSGGTTSDNTIGIQWGNGPVGTIQLSLTGPGIYCQTPTIEQVPIIGSGLAVSGTTTPCLYNNVSYSTQLIPGGVYNWTVDPNFGSIQSGQGTNQVQVYFWATGNTAVSVAVSHEILSCTANPSLTVTPLQPFTIYGPATACTGVPATYTTSQTGNFNWTVQGGTVVSGNGTETIVVLWNTTGTYSVTANISTGFCNTTAQITVSVVKPIKETIQGNNQACINSTQTYFISPNESSYLWSAGSGGTIVGSINSNSVQITWTTAGNDTATVFYSNINGCPDTAYYIVNIATDSVPNFTGDTVACYGSNETFSFTPVPGVSYVWETGGAVITGGQNTGAVSVMWTGTQIGLIRLRNTVCNTYLQKNIVIRPIPLVNILPENLNCTGSSADLVVAQDYPGYLWNNSATTQSITITSTGVYAVTVTDAFGCTGNASDNANPIPSNGFTSHYIDAEPPAGPSPIAYLRLIAEGTPIPTSYVWSTNNNTEQEEDVDAAGTYSVTMTNQYGCTASASETVTTVTIGGSGGGGGGVTILPCNINPPIFTTNNPICNPVQFNPTMTANYWLWDFGDNLYSQQSNPSHRFITAGTQNVTLYYSQDGLTWYQCSQSFVINSVMNIGFTSTGGCKGAITLTNTATSALPITSVLWRLGDGNTSNTTPVLNYQYPNNASSYNVSLILTDAVCTDSLQKPVNVNELSADFIYTGICVNNPALFNDATTHTAIISSYSWNFGNGQTADYYDPITYYTNAGNYTGTLTVTDATGCTDTYTQNVPVNQFTPPTITASGPLAFCRGSSVTLTLPASNSYYWNDAETTSSIQVTQSGNFFAWAQNTATGCSGFTDTVAVTENIPPSAYIGNPGLQTEICEYNNLILNGWPNGATSYQWYQNGVAGSTGQDQYFWYAQTSQTGDYQLVITDANGCKDTSAILHIDINPVPATPVINQSPSGVVCAGQPVTLSVTGTDFYQWSTGNAGNTTVITQNGNYQVFATNNFGCTSYTYFYANFSPTPDFSLFPVGCYQICPNTNLTVSGPAGMQSYLWSDGETTQTITLTNSGTYSLDATATGGCSAKSDSFTVDVFSAANIQLGNDTNICNGQTVVLNAGAYPQITWGDGTTTQTYTVTDSGMYYVTVTTSAGCTASDSILVSVHSDSVNLGNDTSICSNMTLLLSVNGNYTSITWQNGSTGNIFSVTQTGIYTVNVTDMAGCSSSGTISVTTLPNTQPEAFPAQSLCDSTDTLAVNGSYSIYNWSTGSTAPSIVVSDTGTYYVTVTDANGCTSADTAVVLACDTPPCERPNRYYIPNVFSPNGDGRNDEFGIYIKPGSASIQMFSMKIFDRWGEKLFETENETATWDGRYKGSYVAQGVLSYVIKYQTAEENSTIKGTVTLLR